MASPKIIASRYSKALFSFLDKSSKREVLEKLIALRQSITGSPELQGLLSSPVFTIEEKLAVMKELVGALKVSNSVGEFIKVLISSKRIEVFSEVVEDFKKRVLAEENAVEGLVETALPLSTTEMSALQKIVESLFKKKVVLETRIEPKLIAGVRVHVLGKTLDTSLESSLQVMQRKLLQAEA